MYPHRIRLRGPWECELLEGRGEPLSGRKARMMMPCRWDEGDLRDFSGRVRLRRRFGYPGRIDDYERVWLTFAGVDGSAEMSLNGQLLGRRDGASGPFEFEVTGQLQARNELLVEMEISAHSGGLWGEVALEVRCAAFLSEIDAWMACSRESTHLHVTGEVVGTCDKPLELYVLFDNATVIYTTVRATPAGWPFRVVSEALPAEHRHDATHRVRVELVNGASIWYSDERVLEIKTHGA